jgi:2-dehydro-3-deoxyphosphooctonate aldolase (KDO 8-P synthase)
MSNFYDYSGLKFIAGPCLLESYDHACEMIERISSIMRAHSVHWVYKTSFDKANRTSHESPRGLGIDQSFYIFSDLKQKYPQLEILTDIHEAWQGDVVAADILQIPAFLCRQTDLLESAAKTNKTINVKKGQFLSPSDMFHVVKKLEHFGCKEIMLTERGTTFGYNNLVVDMRSLQIMHDLGYPVVMDCTHSVQAPGGLDGKSGGDRRFAPTLAYAACATGYCNTIFMEVHDNPDEAPSDGPNMIDLSDLNSIVEKLKRIDDANNPDPALFNGGKEREWAELQVAYDRFDG